MEPDYISDTQPGSEWHTLRRPPLEKHDMWGATPLDQLWCHIQSRQAEYQGCDRHRPPKSAAESGVPATMVGAGWGSVALDPEDTVRSRTTTIFLTITS